ncbi:dynein heavy chain 3, axonemal-like [Fundulus heteroclitus]|uniref:dynein heavy chain 3, axonemal-like n=1 Tax=Fundulus heteroclitus TaxID=8078 RepID=UPI00165BAF69|nr:dynein heavy chain 3, axonemal-like [Fundulus heteroclitus]
MPSSRPVSPTEQLVIMHRQEALIRATQSEPGERDLERYTHYINTSVPIHMLAPYSHQQMVNIMSRLPPEREGASKHLRTLRDDLTEEVKRDYYSSLRKSIGKTVGIYSGYKKSVCPVEIPALCNIESCYSAVYV